MRLAALKYCLAVALPGACAHAQTALLARSDAPPNLVSLPATTISRVQPGSSKDSPAFPSEYQSQWTGIYFKTAFKGSHLYLRIGKNHEILHIVVDDEKPLTLVNPVPDIYSVSRLQDKAHQVSVFIATESQDGPDTFGGFAITPDEQALSVRKANRQIEFIGDSHTVGYGNTSPKHQCTQDEIWANTDDTQAFGAVTAAHYQADYQVNAISGRGVVRNYNGFAGDTLPAAYPYVLFDKQNKVTDLTWNPQIIVIALGTNDFSTPLNPGERWKTREELHADYEASYVRFLQALHASHPHAFLILWATDMAHGEIESEVQKVALQAKALGITRLIFLPIDYLSFTGCDSHPSLSDDQTISRKLEQVIDATPHVWSEN